MSLTVPRDDELLLLRPTLSSLPEIDTLWPDADTPDASLPDADRHDADTPDASLPDADRQPQLRGDADAPGADTPGPSLPDADIQPQLRGDADGTEISATAECTTTADRTEISATAECTTTSNAALSSVTQGHQDIGTTEDRVHLKRRQLRAAAMSNNQNASTDRMLADERMSADSRSLLGGLEQQREQVLIDASSQGLVLPPSSNSSGYRYVMLSKQKAFYARLEATPTRASYNDGPYQIPEAAALSAVMRLEACDTAASAAKRYRDHAMVLHGSSDTYDAEKADRARRAAAATEEARQLNLTLETADTASGYRDILIKPYRGAVTADFPGFSSYEARVTLQAEPGCPSQRKSLGNFRTAPEAALHRAKRVRDLEASGVQIARARQFRRTE